MKTKLKQYLINKIEQPVRCEHCGSLCDPNFVRDVNNGNGVFKKNETYYICLDCDEWMYQLYGNEE